MTDPLPRPEPVLNFGTLVANWQRITAAVVGLVVAFGAAAVLVGWATQGQVEDWAKAVGGICGGVGTLLAVLLPLIGAKQATEQAAIVREKVTPLESPRNNTAALVDANFATYGRHAAAPDEHSASMGPDLPA